MSKSNNSGAIKYDSQRKINYLAVIFIFLLFNNYQLKSQDEELTDIDKLKQSDSIKTDNSTEYGIDKLINIYNYYFNLDYKNQNEILNFEIKQNYLGNTLKSQNSISRDEEKFSLILDKPIYDNISAKVSSNFSLISNPGSFNLNKIQRLNALTGIMMKENDARYFEFDAGAESNSQAGYHSNGWIGRFKTEYKDYELGGYNISLLSKGEFLGLDLERNNNDLSINTNIFKYYDFSEHINLDFTYRLMDRNSLIKRDSAYLFNNDLSFDYSVEKRFNNFYMLGLDLGFELLEILDGVVKLNINNNNVEKGYWQFVPKDSRTGINQFRNLMKFNIESELYFRFRKLHQTIGANLYYESDENTVLKKNDISENEYERYKANSYDLDINSSTFKLYSKSNYRLNNSDSIVMNLSSMILRYDTPSPRNNSDRDEFLAIINLNYFNKVSDVMTMVLTSELQLYHYVNLKSQLSGSNFWMRTLRLSPGFIIKTKGFVMRPYLSILANYVVDDFEVSGQEIKSYSLRQISYNDSISIKLSPMIYLNTRLDVIYKETGILYWNKFKELPLNGNLKFFSRFFFTYSNTSFPEISVGIRYYNLSQTNFSSGQNFAKKYTNISFGPETTINYRINENTSVTFSGWYEFLYLNDKLTNEIPNFILKSSIKL